MFLYGNGGYIEIEYTNVDADDATLDLGTQGFTRTFNSYGSILGLTFPYTLDKTTNLASATSTASLLIFIPPYYTAQRLMIYVTPGSVTAGTALPILIRTY